MEKRPLAIFATRQNIQREQVEKRFHDEGFDTRFAADGAELKTLIEDTACFAVFLCSEFDKDSLSLFKSLARTRSLRWILFTHQTTTRTRSGLFSQGAYDVLNYPVQPVQLLLKARQAFVTMNRDRPANRVHDLSSEPGPNPTPTSGFARGSKKKNAAVFEEQKRQLEAVRQTAKELPPKPTPADSAEDILAQERAAFEKGLSGLYDFLTRRLESARDRLESSSVTLYSLRPEADPQKGVCPDTAFALAGSESRPGHNEAVSLVDLPQLWAVFHDKRGLGFGESAGSQFSWVEPALTAGDVEVALLTTYDRPRVEADEARLEEVRKDLGRHERAVRTLDFLSRVYRMMGIR